MKRKLRIGLTAELIIIFIISLISSTLGVVIVFNRLNISVERINRYLFPSNYKDNVILSEYSNNAGKDIDNFINKNMNDIKIPHKVDDKLKESFQYGYNAKILVFVVNSKGEIINSNNKKEMFNIQVPMLKEILEVNQEETGMAQITNVKKISSDLYMIVIKDVVIQGDFIMILIGIFVFIVIFALLGQGRLKYIISIEKGIHKLYSSEFQEKVPLKYNNELTSLAISLNDMGGKIKENKENEKEFLLNISHDLRTPLTSILGFLNLLKQKKYDREEERERYVNVVEEQCLYLKTLIDEFFEFSKLKWKNIVFDKENIKMQEILRQVSDGFYPQLKEDNINICMNFPETPVYKEVDIDKFMRALENILSNAIKYSRKETEINLNLYQKKDQIVIEFWNNPEEAINEEELNLLFKRFFKKDLSRNSKGAGLGLAIALEIIKLHGGVLQASLKNERLGIIIKL